MMEIFGIGTHCFVKRRKFISSNHSFHYCFASTPIIAPQTTFIFIFLLSLAKTLHLDFVLSIYEHNY
ncbi:hypothetical protein L2E82_17180 [Cichorium intybus]|uniref:Uncharacterized protein n=1 Tax=Cichorium intybus TaxID=13427 RepID=A0ACB9F711_CICIN|nr:hypothetical protein L2E82_17180 [Cichorium intybus]